MSIEIDEKLRKYIENLQHEAVDDIAAGSGQRHEQAAAQEHPAAREHPVSSQPSNQQGGTLYSRIATVLMVLLLVATGVSYYLYRVEHAVSNSRIEATVRAPLAAPLEDQFLELERKLVANSRANKIRLQAFEQRLTDNQQAYGQQLQEMGQRLMQLHEPQEQRLQHIEQRLASRQQPDGERMQAIENRLTRLTARMDGLAAAVADLSGDDPSVSPLHAATAAEPPPAHPLEPVTVALNNAVLQAPKSLPGAARDQPPLAAPASTAQSAQRDWVINIGSYMRESIATRKLAEFRKQGVDAELETATVRGKTIYRVQVPGFISMAEARNYTSQVQETLGLKETWVRRR